MGRIGVYTGTFDPVHQGHVLFALIAARIATLEKVVFIPEPQPRRKTNVTSIGDRLAMLKFATNDYDHLEAEIIDNSQFDVSGTLPVLQRRFGRELVLLFGSDVAKTIPSWSDLGKLFTQAELLIALRRNDDEQEVKHVLSKTGAKFICIPSPENGVSSSDIRSKQQTDYLHRGVADYIAQNQLYPLAPSAN